MSESETPAEFPGLGPGFRRDEAGRRYIDLAEFQRIGFLQEANRLFFHPHGLALAITHQQDRRTALVGALAQALHQIGEDRAADEANELVTRLERSGFLPPLTGTMLEGVWDDRDDPEGVVFAMDEQMAVLGRERAAAVEAELERHVDARLALFDGVGAIQPLDVYPPPTEDRRA